MAKKNLMRTRKKSGGATGKMERVFFFNEYPVFGAGGYGIVVKTKQNEVLKLFKNLEDCDLLKKEAEIQLKAYFLFKKYLPEVKVPKVTYFTNRKIVYNNKSYLCGIAMKYAVPPLDFEEQVHILLGYNQDDIDESWGAKVSEPVSDTNPTRGFFASPQTMKEIWKAEDSDMTIKKAANLMGRSLRLLLDFGILPNDLEWVWSRGNLWLLDFGLCDYGKADPLMYLLEEGSRGLKNDIYIPHEGDEGYDEFIKGYLNLEKTH